MKATFSDCAMREESRAAKVRGAQLQFKVRSSEFTVQSSQLQFQLELQFQLQFQLQ
jgi:hypothetical protein